MIRRLPSALTIYTIALIAFLFAPVLTVAVFSFERRGVGTFPIEGFTTKWYEALVDDRVMIDSTLNSAYVALGTAAIAIVLGSLAAFALVRYRVRFAAPALTAIIVLPIVLPPLLVGVALLSFFSRAGVAPSLGTVVISHVLITMPFVVLTINARLAGMDLSLEEAADSLGATRGQTFRHVTMPLIRSSVMGSALLVIALSLDEFVVTFFTIGSDPTLPVTIWAQMRAGVSPVVNAVATLMLLATLLIVVLARRLTDIRPA